MRREKNNSGILESECGSMLCMGGVLAEGWRERERGRKEMGREGMWFHADLTCGVNIHCCTL